MKPKGIISLIILVLALVGLYIYQSLVFFDGKLHVVVCNVGQGDAIFIRTSDAKDILIDGGPDNSVLDCLSNHMPFWDRDIELVMLSHPHSDHYTGLLEVMKRYKVIHYVTEKVENGENEVSKLNKELADKNLNAKHLLRGDKIDISGQTQLLTLWPEKGMAKLGKDTDINGSGLIELLTFQSFKMLLTDDVGYKSEELASSGIGMIDVLKVPHHGSSTGMSKDFLSNTDPRLAVISVGKGNSFGHPALTSLNLLKEDNIKTLRTDMDGEVEIVSDGKSFTYKTN